MRPTVLGPSSRPLRGTLERFTETGAPPGLTFFVAGVSRPCCRRDAGQRLTTHHPPAFEIEAGVPFHRACLPVDRVPSAGTARISVVIFSALGWQL